MLYVFFLLYNSVPVNLVVNPAHNYVQSLPDPGLWLVGHKVDVFLAA